MDTVISSPPARLAPARTVRARTALARVAVALVVLVGLAPSATAATGPGPGLRAQGLARVLASVEDPSEVVRAVATFAERPSSRELAALERLGLGVQGLEHLPVALVAGPVTVLRTAVATGIARDVYPDERLRHYVYPEERLRHYVYPEERLRHYAEEPARQVAPVSIRESGASLGVAALHGRGVTGRGVGVAIVDSGVDAGHPDLAGNVAHNVKVVGPGYPYYPSTGPTFVLPVDSSVGDNSDLAGHGTHVAGIVAADATTAPDQVGIAPEATLHAYSVGEVFVHTVLGAFDHILAHHAERGIRVVNNSWGGAFRLFDPSDPINLGTRALADAGLVVVFAAGNDGAEMTMNPYSVAPWVIAAGSSDVKRHRSGFSSGGLQYDNSTAVEGLLDGHRRFRGAGPGLYHPDVSAPGTAIVSSSSAPAVLNAPNPPCSASLGGACRATLSGTSMAAPHVSGMAALLLQEQPNLTPRQVRLALQSTASTMADDSPLFRSGYGVAHARAVDAVGGRDFGRELTSLQRRADRRVAAADLARVQVADHWGFTAPGASAAGLDRREFAVPIVSGTTAVKVVVAFPGLPPSLVSGSNVGGYEALLLDAQGRTIASAVPGRSSTTILEADLPADAAGQWRLVLSSTAVVGPDTLGPELPGERRFDDAVSVTVAQVTEGG